MCVRMSIALYVSRVPGFQPAARLQLACSARPCLPKKVGRGAWHMDPDAAEEDALLRRYRDLLEQEADASRKVQGAQRALDARVRAKYGRLSVEEVQTLAVDDKWLATLAVAVQGERERVSQALTGRIRQLAERSATPLPSLTCEAEALAARVDAHLHASRAAWK